jgi:hypothetical protein
VDVFTVDIQILGTQITVMVDLVANNDPKKN